MDLIGVKLTPRDQQVLNLLVQDSSNQEIAGQLSIRPRIVKPHLRTLFLRAGIRHGRKGGKLAIAAFENQGSDSTMPRDHSLRRNSRSLTWSGKG
jgi:DNA-binding NarL/FixJ family response regulator